MRITDTEKQVMIEAVKRVDTDAALWLFGSRNDFFRDDYLHFYR
jgi:hypothetical protein